MKKFITVFLTVLLMLGVCACNDGGTPIEANESTFLVNFHVDCDADVYAVHFEYYLDSVPIGGGETGNVYGLRMTAEDVFTADFIPNDFPENADLSQFQLEIFLADKNGAEYPCKTLLDFAVEYGEIYDISISGNYEDGFSANIT